MKHSLALVVILVAACGGKSKPADPGGGGGGGGEAAVPEGPLAAGQWESLDHETRAKFMGKVVMPEMKQRFQAFDATEFAEFDCETCHGSGVATGQFEMPNPELPGLDGDMIMNPDADHQAITDFMKNEVRPTTATLLGLPEWGPEKPDGFGCMHCHPMKQ
jgi:hypothetical protein